MYSLEDYNEELSRLGTDFSTIYVEKNMYFVKIVDYLTDNVLLSNSEIDEFLEFIKEGLLEYKIDRDMIGSKTIFNLINMMLIESDKRNNKWYLYSRYLFRDLEEFDLEFGFNHSSDGFCIRDKRHRYVCYLDEFGRDTLEEFSPMIRGNCNIFFGKNLVIAKIKNDNIDDCEIDVLYRDNNKFYSTLNDHVYDRKNIDVLYCYNQFLSNLGLGTKEVYTKYEVEEFISMLNNFSSLKELEVVREMAICASNWWNDVIFSSCDDIYGCYNKLLPTYTIEQQENFKNELYRLILEKLMKFGEMELSVIPKFNNELINLMNKLFVIPTSLVIGRVMKIDLESSEIVIEDKKTGKTDLLYKKSEKTRKK